MSPFMEKGIKGLFVVIISLFLLPIVVAEISMQGPGKSVVNIGDEITVSGYVMRNTNTIATLKFMLSCSTEIQLLVKSISLQANVQKVFSEDLVIPSYLEGTCAIRAVLESSGNVLEETASPSFTISRDLIGTLSMDKTSLKRGDPLKITGTITKLDGASIDGVATLRFKQEQTEVFIDTITIANGDLSYTLTTNNLPAGTFMIEVTPQDVYGNTKTLTIGPFTISGEILIFAEPNKLHFNPGEHVKIEGTATILDLPVQKATLWLTLGENKIEDDINDGHFSKTIQIPYTITSGTQTITLEMEDLYGNRGSLPLSIIIDPSPTKLDFTKEKESYLPHDTVKITPRIVDQAGNIITTDIGIIISNPKGKEIFSDTIASNTEYEFQLHENALPGAWKVKLLALDMEYEGTILVGEHIDLEYLIINNTLLITNRGNVHFSNPIKVEYKSLEKKFTLVKEFTIEANETVQLDLAKGMEPGIYDIYIDDKIFKDIPITKKGRSAEDMIVIILAIIALGIFLALVWYLLGWLKHTRRPPHFTMRKKESWDNKRVLAVSHPRNEREHVRMFKEKMASSMEDHKQKMHFKVKKAKGPDEYIYELPQKKQHVEEPRKHYPSWDLDRTSEPPGWSEPSSRRDDGERNQPEYSYVEPSYEEPEKKSDASEKKKGGLFSMFD